MDKVLCRAVCVVRADRRYLPGETLELDRTDFDALLAAGGVEAVEPDSGVVDPARAPTWAAPGRPAGTLTDISGIGPVTAGRLHVMGVDSLAALAALTDEELERTAGALDVIGDETAALMRWRDDARTLLSGDA